MLYEYEKELPPLYDLNLINEEIDTSEMTDKTVLWIRYDAACTAEPPASACLKLNFQNELSVGDKDILDGIVAGLPS